MYKEINNILFAGVLVFLSYFVAGCEKSSPEEIDAQKQNEVIIGGKSILLTANNCFFYPVGTLQAVEDKANRSKGTEFNKGWVLTQVTNWKQMGDTIIWAVKNCEPGELKVTPKMGVPAMQAGSEINVHVNGETKSIKLNSTGSATTFKKQESVSFTINKTGTQTIKLTLKQLKSQGNIGDLQECTISGSAIKNAEVWNRRWRPLAVHCRWHSSKEPEKVVVAIHENIIYTTNVDMYQPTTTPFGYTGSTWKPKEQTFGGYNFSLWSFSANEEEPPLVELSHLIAVGKGLTFGEYGHEGTGVKPRGPNPYEGYKTNRQVVAVRKVPGVPYDTYYSYYLHPGTNKWTLYGCGRKFNKKQEITYLTTGAFIEQPGAPTTTRNGHLMREVHYSGWLMDENNNWYPVDKMEHNGDDSSLSYKNWGVKDGKFFMQMGGIKENVVEAASVALPNSPSPENRPDYLKGDMLEGLYKLPAQLEEMPTENIKANSATVRFNLIDGGTSPKATIFWGEFDALTFDYKWENKKEISISEGINAIALNGLISGKKYFFRVQIVNEEGIVWLMDTQNFTTK